MYVYKLKNKLAANQLTGSDMNVALALIWVNFSIFFMVSPRDICKKDGQEIFSNFTWVTTLSEYLFQKRYRL